MERRLKRTQYHGSSFNPHGHVHYNTQDVHHHHIHRQNHPHGVYDQYEEIQVTDFSMAVNLTQFIANQWTRLVSIPRNGAKNQTIQEDIQEYCTSKNKFKE
jgi:hypothetical protein